MECLWVFMFGTVSFFFLLFCFCILYDPKGPDDFNGYGYFYVRLYWSGFSFQANIVEDYVF